MLKYYKAIEVNYGTDRSKKWDRLQYAERDNMKKLDMQNVYADYDDFMEQHGEAVLKDAVKAIQPDVCGMDRDGALRLAGAMKNCGFSKEDFAEVLARSSQDKGTFAKQWRNFRGSGEHGEATEGTIYQFAQASGWEWPEPQEFVKDNGLQGKVSTSKSAAGSKKPQLENLARWKPDITFSCIMDSEGYTQKPASVWEVRNREQSPTPAPEPITIAQFVDAVTSGHTFSPRVYNKMDTGKRDENGRIIYDYYPVKQQLFVVDMDNEEPALDENGKPIKGQKKRISNYKSIEDAIEICKQHGIMPFLVYETFSSKAHREDPAEPYKKFRLCFLLDAPVTVRQFGLNGMNAVTEYFIKLFGQAADGKTKDTARLIYGTDEKDSIQQYNAVLDSKKILQAAFAKQLNQDEEEPPEDPAEQKTGEELLEDFLQTVAGREFEPIPTGIQDLDRALEGGFMRKTLVMLGAAPGMGKTALAQWIFENMAEHGQDVLYINLEMAREQLLARSLSRTAWKYYRADLSAIEIMRGYEWTDETKETVANAARVYREKVAPHFVYNPEGVTKSIDSILDTMKAETKRIKAQGKPAPIICIDYLQVISTSNRDPIEGMKDAILQFKDFAKDNETVVFLIMANNRASNKTGTAELESGRDTSAIEYSGDLMLGLAYTAIEDHETYNTWANTQKGDVRLVEKVYTLDKVRQLKKYAYENNKPVPEVCTRISLKVLKNRFGQDERRANFVFDGKHSVFKQIEYRYSNNEDYMPDSKKIDAEDDFKPLTDKPEK